MTKLIDKNTTIPTNASQVFSTAENNQTAVTVHVLQGEREVASGNKSLGRFDLADIPPAPRGTPQIDVVFDIDANGILNVSAKDKATGKEQSVIIKASSGLSDEDVDRMLKDAEIHADEDRKLTELVAVRNQAESMINAVEKSLEELADQVQDDEKAAIETAVNDLQEAIKGDDKEAIEAKTTALTELSGKLAERAYAQKAEGSDDDSGPDSSDAGANAESTEDVVDAEFEEVKDEKKDG